MFVFDELISKRWPGYTFDVHLLHVVSRMSVFADKNWLRVHSANLLSFEGPKLL